MLCKGMRDFKEGVDKGVAEKVWNTITELGIFEEEIYEVYVK